MSDYRKLSVVTKAHAVTLRVYALTRKFPREETYGLAAQMRRATVSIGSNIAEGTGKATPGELRQALGHAQGSVHELQYQCQVPCDLGYLDTGVHATIDAEIREVRAMLEALRRRV